MKRISRSSSTMKRASALLGFALAVPLFSFGQYTPDSVRMSIRLADEVPGLRYRDDPDSLFRRSATVFEDELGMSTEDELSGAVAFLADRFGIVAACPLMPVLDIAHSDFLSGNIVFTDGAHALYVEEDLAGGPCPASPFDPRQPSFYLETISQKGDYTVDLAIDSFHLPVAPSATFVQVLVLPVKTGLALGGSYFEDHGPYELIPLAPADLTEPYDDILYGELRLSWFGGFFSETVHFESLEPNTTTPAGGKRNTFRLESDAWGTGFYEATYRAMATEWAEDPELTGNPVLGIPRNPILTPRYVNFRYEGTGDFPFDPATFAHAPCQSDFSDPNHLEICPPGIPTP